MAEPSAAGKAEKPESAIYTPCLVTDRFLAEEAWIPSRETPFFWVHRFGSDPDGGLEDVEEFKYEGKIYRPVDGAALRKGLVFLPQIPKRCTFEKAFKEGCDLSFEIYDCEESKRDELKFLVGVAQSSWFLDKFTGSFNVAGMGRFAPVIALRGPSGSGKNRALNALRLNSYRPFYDQATNRVPSLFRPLDTWGGTLALDEMDLRFSDETSEVIHYLNCRAYGTPISRQNPEAVNKAEAFSNFGLTMVTQRRAWEDNATEDRTLPFYCEKSQRDDLPTTELDEWIEQGIELQNMLLYLRLTFWDRIRLDKAARVQGVRDHRLTSSVLPLLALGTVAPGLSTDLKGILLKLERKRKEVKAQSPDGLIVNALYERVTDGLLGEHNGIHYIGSAIDTKSDDMTVLPPSPKDLADELGWESKGVRKVVTSLQLCARDAPRTARIGGKVFRPFWFTPDRLAARFREFVLDYDDQVPDLYRGAGPVTSATPVTAQTDLGLTVTLVSDVTLPIPLTVPKGVDGNRDNDSKTPDTMGSQGQKSLDAVAISDGGHS